jgi:hypothetical protein
MPFDWREYLVIAHELRNDPREAVQRVCLGRAYYYVYNLGLGHARTMNFAAQPPGLHKKLWNWCQSHADPRVKRIGINGVRMLALRHEADYDSALIPNLAREVQQQLSRARQIEELVSQTNGQNPPPALVA